MLERLLELGLVAAGGRQRTDSTRVIAAVRDPEDQSAILAQVRADQNSQDWKAKYAVRAGIEGTVHQAVASAGCRRSRYKSLPKTRLAHIFVAAAINFIRLDAWWSERPLAPTGTSHLARLQLAA
ncbi:transposase [Kitasatospora sp. NPDC056531]|uniref:transposase n=1 Tax=Kitasatospora sp. NPDC056531 TaxID=3345856 RepID=UPI0036ABE6AA